MIAFWSRYASADRQIQHATRHQIRRCPRGLLLEAERLYQSAVASDGSVAEAHTGLADVRERSGDTASARKEAQTSLELKPSAEAYLVLGRLDLADNHLDQAGKEAAQALQLDPANRSAQDLSRQVTLKFGKSQ